MPWPDDDKQEANLEPGIGTQLINAALTPINALGTVLGAPGSAVRGLLAGKGLESFTSWTTGRELLDSWGVFPKGEGFDIAGLAADFIDPFLFAGSITGLTKFGRASEAVLKMSKTLEALKTEQKLAEVAGDVALATKHAESAASLGEALAAKTVELGGRAPELERGLEAAIPFTNISSGKLADLAPLQKLSDKITGAIKIPKLFNTAKETEVGQFLTNQKQNELNAFVGASVDRFNGFSERLKEIAKTEGLTTEEANNALRNSIETMGTAEKVRNLSEAKLSEIDIQTDRQLTMFQDYLDSFGPQSSKREDVYNEMVRLTKRADARKADVILERDSMLSRVAGKQGSELMQSLAKDFLKGSEEQLAQAKSLGIAMEQLSDVFNYAPHVLSKEGYELFKSDPAVRTAYQKDLNTLLSPSRERGYPGELIEEINAKWEKKTGIKNFFESDPIIANEKRAYLHQVAVSRAQAIHTAANLASEEIPEMFVGFDKFGNKFSVTSKEFDALTDEVRMAHDFQRADPVIPEGMMPLAKLYQESKGLTGAVFADGTRVDWGLLSGKAEQDMSLIQEALTKAGKGNRVIPEAVYRDLVNLDKVYTTGQSRFLKYYDQISDVMRVGLTSISPQYLGTENLGKTIMNFISGVSLGDYYNSLKNYLAYRGNVDPEGMFGRFAGEVAPVAREFFEGGYGGKKWISGVRAEQLEGNLTRGILVDNPVTRASTGVNAFFDDVHRLAHYIGKRAENLDPYLAGESVKKYLFDHSDFTNFEKQVGKRLFLFYGFARKNFPLALKEMVTNQRAYALARGSQATLDSEQYVPEYLKTTGSIYVGGDRFIDIRNPLFEANRFSPQGESLGRGIERGVLSFLSPQLRVPLEMITGKEFFSGKPIAETTQLPSYYSGAPFTQTVTNKQGQPEVYSTDKNVLTLLRNMPTTRLAQIPADLVNPKVDAVSILGPRSKVLPLSERKQTYLKTLLERRAAENPELAQYHKFFNIAEEPSDQTIALLELLKKKSEPRSLF